MQNVRSRPEHGMMSRNEDLVSGVFVEVLWDIEQESKEGRRRGEVVLNTIWRLAEVVKVRIVDGRQKVTLRYDGRDGFEQQIGEVWMFSRHLRPVDDDSTQLRWRYYECSGDVQYDVQDVDLPDVYEHSEVECSGKSSERLKLVEHKLGTLIHQYEALERMVVSQNLLFTRMLGEGSKGGRVCARLFANLRQKLALLLQKPVPPLKTKKDTCGGENFYEDSCAGYISVDVDCDLDIFQEIARVVISKFKTAHFRPSLTEIQCGSPSMEECEIKFASFSDIAAAIGITSDSDIMSMAIRQRGNLKKEDVNTLDVALRVVGTCLFDTNDEYSATALLVCKSIHENCLSDTLHALVRDTREYDFASRTYRNPLKHRTCTGQSLLKTVFSSRLASISEHKQIVEMKGLTTEFRNFSLRWRANIAPSSRTWSKNLVTSQFLHGIVEMEIPFLILRGPESVSEVKKFLYRQSLGLTHIAVNQSDDYSSCSTEGIFIDRNR